MKSKLTINVETFLLEEAKQNHINLSQSTEEALRSKLSIIKGDSSGINKQLLTLQIDKLRSKINKDSAELSILSQKLQSLEVYEKEQVENQLKESKEKLDKMNRCINCSSILNDHNRIELKNNVFLCKSCYHTCDVKKHLK